MAVHSPKKQVNIRVDDGLYRSVESVARQERRTVPQTARLLLEEGLQARSGHRYVPDDSQSSYIAGLAMAGGSFEWLADEPELYNDDSGEPA